MAFGIFPSSVSIGSPKIGMKYCLRFNISSVPTMVQGDLREPSIEFDSSSFRSLIESKTEINTS